MRGVIWVIYKYRSISGNSLLFLCYVSVFMLTLAILITTALGCILNSDSIIHPDLFCQECFGCLETLMVSYESQDCLF